MAQAQARHLVSQNVTVRKGNRRFQISEWAQGRRVLPAFLSAMMFVLAALAFVWTNHQSVQSGYRIAEMHREKAALVDVNREYKVELANLTALDRLEYLAKKELGLISPRPDQMQVIE